jgi:hypothetical protein
MPVLQKLLIVGCGDILRWSTPSGSCAPVDSGTDQGQEATAIFIPIQAPPVSPHYGIFRF